MTQLALACIGRGLTDLGWGPFPDLGAAAPELGFACLAKHPTLGPFGIFPASSQLTVGEGVWGPA